MIDVRAAARLLGGDVIGRDAVAAPGPGHSPRDRSLTVKFAAHAPGGFLVYALRDRAGRATFLNSPVGA